MLGQLAHIFSLNERVDLSTLSVRIVLKLCCMVVKLIITSSSLPAALDDLALFGGKAVEVEDKFVDPFF